MVGRGLVMSRGVGRRITMAVGFSITTVGPGCRAAITTRSAAGGVPRSLPSSVSVFHLVTISAGIRCRTTSAILTRDSIDATIRIMVAADVMAADAMVTDVMQVVDATVMDVTQAGGARVMDAKGVTDVKVKVASPEDVSPVVTSTGAV
jgi:hypothetical protein